MNEQIIMDKYKRMGEHAYDLLNLIAFVDDKEKREVMAKKANEIFRSRDLLAQQVINYLRSYKGKMATPKTGDGE